MHNLKVALIHPHMEVPGGGEEVALNIATSLRDFGYNITIYTFHPSDIDKACTAFRIDCNGIRAEKMPYPLIAMLLDLVFKRKAFNKWIALAELGGVFKTVESIQGRYNLIIHTHAFLPLPVDAIYVHYPDLAIKIPLIQRRSLIRRAYDAVTELYIKHLLHKLNRSNPLILTNSFWTASTIRRVWGLNATVLHPPVDVDYFGKVFNNDKREKMIVTVSRFVKRKNLDKIPKIASALRDYRFIIAGAKTPTSDIVLNRITSECRKLGCNNVEIVLNPSREEIRSLLGEAMFYLHPPFPEHFGIAIAEAIAAGAIPIVYRDGGGWTDIVSRISSELGYRDISEVSMIIRRLENNESKLYELRKIGRDVVNDFRPERFRENLRRIIEGLLHDNSRGRAWQQSLQV